jgi:hypothetical protein
MVCQIGRTSNKKFRGRFVALHTSTETNGRDIQHSSISKTQLVRQLNQSDKPDNEVTLNPAMPPTSIPTTPQRRPQLPQPPISSEHHISHPLVTDRIEAQPAVQLVKLIDSPLARLLRAVFCARCRRALRGPWFVGVRYRHGWFGVLGRRGCFAFRWTLGVGDGRVGFGWRVGCGWNLGYSWCRSLSGWLRLGCGCAFAVGFSCVDVANASLRLEYIRRIHSSSCDLLAAVVLETTIFSRRTCVRRWNSSVSGQNAAHE